MGRFREIFNWSEHWRFLFKSSLHYFSTISMRHFLKILLKAFTDSTKVSFQDERFHHWNPALICTWTWCKGNPQFSSSRKVKYRPWIVAISCQGFKYGSSNVYCLYVCCPSINLGKYRQVYHQKANHKVTFFTHINSWNHLRNERIMICICRRNTQY